MSYLGLNITNYLMSPEDVVESPPLHGTPCLADRIILPTEDRITFCGATFDIIHTPGHTVDHICTRTPDNVLYLGDAMMTGRTLHHSKFPFAFCVRDYLDSMRKMRTEPADKFIVAHYGIYDEILPLVDMEARFFAERMVDLLDLVDGPTTPAKMAADICRTYHIDAGGPEKSVLLCHLQPVLYQLSAGLGYLEAYIEDNQIFYRRTPRLLRAQGAEKPVGAAEDRTVPVRTNEMKESRTAQSWLCGFFYGQGTTGQALTPAVWFGTAGFPGATPPGPAAKRAERR